MAAGGLEIPDALRAELVAAREAKDHSRVNDAAAALGALTGDRARIEATIRALLAHRDGRSICPSDVARVVGGTSWRSAMADVRHVAFDLVGRGLVQVTQKGKPVTIDPPPRGPIRIVVAD